MSVCVHLEYGFDACCDRSRLNPKMCLIKPYYNYKMDSWDVNLWIKEKNGASNK